MASQVCPLAKEPFVPATQRTPTRDGTTDAALGSAVSFDQVKKELQKYAIGQLVTRQTALKAALAEVEDELISSLNNPDTFVDKACKKIQAFLKRCNQTQNNATVKQWLEDNPI